MSGRVFPTHIGRSHPLDNNRSYPTVGGGSPGGAPTDPNFANVGLLVHFDGADMDTTATDQSNSAHTLTFVGAAQLDTAIKQFGTAALQLDNTDDYVSAPDSADWAFGTGEFTIECSIYHTVTPASTGYIAQWASTIGSAAWVLYLTGGTLRFRFYNTSNTLRDTNATWTPSINTWYQIAVDRDASGVIRIYVDGSVVGSATWTDNMADRATALRIGSTAGVPTFQFEGNIDEVRITKGVARYGGAYTPATEPFPDA